MFIDAHTGKNNRRYPIVVAATVSLSEGISNIDRGLITYHTWYPTATVTLKDSYVLPYGKGARKRLELSVEYMLFCDIFDP